MDNKKIIVIAGGDTKDYLWVIALEGQRRDEITLQYIDKYMGTTEALLRILKKSFGWLETTERIKKKIQKEDGRIFFVNEVEIGKVAQIKGL